MDEVKQLIEEYIERYCKTYKVSREEAVEHVMVKLVAKYYSEEAAK